VELKDRGRALEEGWFRENEKKLLEAARLRREAQLAAEKTVEREKLRELHFMKCPKCGSDLAEVEHLGVKIDRCGHCEGIYLDAGELEALFSKKPEERRTIFRRMAGLFEP
jgi:uncharacterized protein